MANLTEEQIMEMYRLSDEQVEKVKQTVIEVMSADKIPNANPLAVIVGGQSGAGKTALISYTALMSKHREFVVIDNDYFRAFHPKAAEIKALYPQYYTHATDQIGLGITSDIVDYFMGNNENNVKYDLIFHQTLRGNRIADDAMAKLRSAGYTVGVRAFAVPYLESKMSQIERCKASYESMGYCRHVRKSDHDAAISGLPQTVRYIEENNKYDFIEIFKRSNDIAEPTLLKHYQIASTFPTKFVNLVLLTQWMLLKKQESKKQLNAQKLWVVELKKQKQMVDTKFLVWQNILTN